MYTQHEIDKQQMLDELEKTNVQTQKLSQGAPGVSSAISTLQNYHTNVSDEIKNLEDTLKKQATEKGNLQQDFKAAMYKLQGMQKAVSKITPELYQMHDV